MELILYLFLAGVGILISVLIMRGVFMIPTIVRNLKIQTSLLEEIAKKNGVSPDKIDGIKNQFN